MTLVTLISLIFITPGAYAVELGTTIHNVAEVSFKHQSGAQVDIETNTVSLLVEALPSTSTIEFFRYAPNTQDALIVSINGSDYAPSGSEDGPFETSAAPVNGATEINTDSPIPLAPAKTYAAGELMFVSVIDKGQNGNSDMIETVTITVTSDSGDQIILRLYESGVDTGEFWAYVPSTRDQTANLDDTLTTSSDSNLTAKYVDKFDETEVSVDTALVDPYSRVFNALTGEYIDNALVTIIDDSTGLPATVYGIDGVSIYPSSVVTGQVTRDASGFAYDLRQGEFRFPLLSPGSYHLEVITPDGYNFSSIYSAEELNELDSGPFEIQEGSYGDLFKLSELGPLNIDLPIDPQSDLVLTKRASPSTGDVGDFIRYTVKVENIGDYASTVTMYDVAPIGFRYIEGSTIADTLTLEDPVASETGNGLTYKLPALPAGDAYTVSYTMQIGAGVGTGEQINSAVITDANGQEISNVARAGVTMTEDLLRTTSTIIGRVTENSCDVDEDWAREIEQGEGVDGVRLYMETGSYVVTDTDGLYHFEGVREGTHVVQVDEATLPAGYEVMVCEENTQYAGRGRSKFVDVKGGGIWRANFYLKNTGTADDLSADTQTAPSKLFGEEWLATQNSAVEWIYPNEGFTPQAKSVDVGIKHGPTEIVTLTLNGSAIPLTNYFVRESNADRTVLFSRWKGLDILHGENVFIATVKNKSGAIIQTLRRDIHYVTDVARAIEVADQSVLVADGRTNPVLAVRIEDEAGHPVHSGRRITVDVQAPHQLEIDDRLENSTELVSPNSGRTTVTVGAGGIARITLEPTLQTGMATVSVSLDDGRIVNISQYLQAEKRDWIVVGLAEGTAGLDKEGGRKVALSDDDNILTDGRIAFFAKGLIKGDWLLTLAVDTDKRRGDRDTELYDYIDPNAYYTLYGDRTYQDHEAQSRYPVYVKLEKNTFNAMFGDYKTSLNDSELTRYNRDLSGFKTEYIGERFDVVGFAAETNQGFAKDEIAANGTSSGYSTRFSPLVVNSEKIYVETRDRFRPDQIIETRELVRHLDYTVDNLTGDIVFRLPVDATDTQLNPNVIVVDYETTQDAERNMTYGGRVTAKFNDDKVKASLTYLHEEGRADQAEGKQDVLGVDVEVQLGTGTEARLEYAQSQDSSDGSQATAYLAEIVHTSEDFSAEAYIREEEKGFGMGQTSSATSDVRRMGVSAAYKLSENINEETGRRAIRNVTGQSYSEENLTTGATRLVSEAMLDHNSERFGVSTGLRQVKETLGSSSLESIMAVASARLTNVKHGFTVSATHEQPLGDETLSTVFPQRTILGVDKTLTDKATVSARHEILVSDLEESQNTVIGVNYAPWTGSNITAQGDLSTQDSAERIGATVGLDQQWQLNDTWSASAGVSRRTILSSTESDFEISDDTTSLLEDSGDHSSIYLGLGYKTDVMSASGRVEALKSDSSDNYSAIASVTRELSETLSIAATARNTLSEREQDDPLEPRAFARRTDVRVGAAWRPRNEDTVIFDRLDYSSAHAEDGSVTKKVVNNFSANTMVNDRIQATWNYGLKLTDATFEGTTYSSTSHLVGGEIRFDVTKKIDIGLHGSALTTDDGSSASYSYGPSIGISPIENTWITLGYNVDGYRDDDFAAAEYANEGVYLKVRMKFDQDTAETLLDAISPNR